MRLVAVFLLVSSAGCSVLLPTSEPDRRDPFDVPPKTAVGDQQNVSVPGLGSDSVTGAYALASAHASRLESTSFAVRYERSVRAGNGTVLRQDRTRAGVAANRTRFVLSTGQWRSGSQWLHDRYWSKGGSDPVLHALERAESTEYVAYAGSGGEPLRVSDISTSDLTYRNRLFRILSTVDRAEVTPTNETRPTDYVVRVNAFTDQWLLADGVNGSVSDPSMLLHVDEAGMVERLYLTYQLSINGSDLTIGEHYQFGSVDSAEIVAPDWHDIALATASERSTSRSRDSVGQPRVSGGGTSWDGNDSGNVSDPHPVRSIRSKAANTVQTTPASGVRPPERVRAMRQRSTLWSDYAIAW